MTTLLVLAILALAAIAATVHDLRADGRGLTPPPASHRRDRDTVPPAQRLSHPGRPS